MTDKELIREVHEGNRDALNGIIEKYYDEIYRFCFYLTGQETESYDITQEVFLRFIRYADSYNDRNLKGYLLTIARNLCNDYFRHRKDTLPLEEIPEAGKEEPQITAAEDRLMLGQALFKIARKQREVILLRIQEDLKFVEIAKLLDCNLSTVKSRYHLGLKNLKKIVKSCENSGGRQ